MLIALLGKMEHSELLPRKTLCPNLGGFDEEFDFPGGSDSKESACNVQDPGLISGSGRSPGEGHGNTLQYSFLGNPMDRGAWRATVHGVEELDKIKQLTLAKEQEQNNYA